MPAIAYFDVVLVEKGVILVLSREMIRYELKEDCRICISSKFHNFQQWNSTNS